MVGYSAAVAFSLTIRYLCGMLPRRCRSTFPGLLLAVIVALSGLSRAQDSVASWTVGAPIFTDSPKSLQLAARV
jgi:hypothetical protein